MRDPYFSLPGISNSSLGQFKKSPKHYLHSKKNPMRPTASMNLGSLFHCFILEPQKFEDYFMFIDESKRPVPDKNYQTKVNKVWWDEQEAKSIEFDLILVDADMIRKAKKMVEAVMNHTTARDLIKAKGNIFESGVSWKKNRSECKGKIDIKNPYFIIDLKSTLDADPYEFHKTIFQRDYHRQISMYLDGDAQGNFSISDLKEAYIIAQENDEPFGTSVHRISEEVIIEGYNEYTNLLDQLQNCIDTNVWQGYEFKSDIDSEGIFNVQLPNWKKS